MAFKKGESGNRNGRPKGSTNKTIIDLREWINNFIDDNREQIKQDWQSLEPKDRIILFEKLLKYSLPTLQATTLTTDFEKMSESELDYIIENLKKSAL